MKNIYVIILTVCFGVVFGRVSNKHAINTSPYDLSYSSQKGEIHKGSDDSDLRWKRRHKKRKKTRRPQRGR